MFPVHAAHHQLMFIQSHSVSVILAKAFCMNKTLFALLLVFGFTTQAQTTIKFIDNNWEKARAEAKQSNKYLFVDAYTDWCYWCKVMDKKTFPDKEVAAYMSANFVALKLEMEHNYGINVAMKYRVNAFPTFLVFSPDGKLVKKIAGYMEPEAFIETLKAALKEPAYAGVSETVDLNFPSFYKNAFGVKDNKKKVEEAEVNTYLDGQQDLFSEVNYSVLTRFTAQLSDKHRNFLFDNKEKYAALYGNDEIEDAIYSAANGMLAKAVKDKNKEGLNSARAFLDKYAPENAEETKAFFQLNYDRGTENWSAFADDVDAFILKNQNKGEYINDWAWTVYEKCGDISVVKKAIGWLKPVIEEKPEYASTDTYAALLYKAKMYAEAKTYAQKAIDLGKAEGQKTEETEQLLKKIDAAQ